MPVTINKISYQQRINVTGDPTVAGAIPCTVNVGDTVYRSDGGDEYLVTAAGLVLGSSLDESPLFTTVTATATADITAPTAKPKDISQLRKKPISKAKITATGTTARYCRFK